jgi:dynactin complex subunit
MPRNGTQGNVFNAPMVEDYSAPVANYNLPPDMLQESNIPMNRQSSQMPAKDRIMSSKLPDEIKMLMIEHPIQQPDSMSGPTLSNDLIEKASRLMNQGNVESKKQQTSQSQPSIDNQSLKQMMREVVQEVLSENGLLVESVSKSNDVFSFRVGKHIFEGKVTKIKKVQ